MSDYWVWHTRASLYILCRSELLFFMHLTFLQCLFSFLALFLSVKKSEEESMVFTMKVCVSICHGVSLIRSNSFSEQGQISCLGDIIFHIAWIIRTTCS